MKIKCGIAWRLWLRTILRRVWSSRYLDMRCPTCHLRAFEHPFGTLADPQWCDPAGPRLEGKVAR